MKDCSIEIAQSESELEVAIAQLLQHYPKHGAEHAVTSASKLLNSQHATKRFVLKTQKEIGKTVVFPEEKLNNAIAILDKRLEKLLEEFQSYTTDQIVFVSAALGQQFSNRRKEKIASLSYYFPNSPDGANDAAAADTRTAQLSADIAAAKSKLDAM